MNKEHPNEIIIKMDVEDLNIFHTALWEMLYGRLLPLGEIQTRFGHQYPELEERLQILERAARKHGIVLSR